MQLKEGGKRVIIEGVAPEIDAGRFAIKRTVGEKVTVEADIFTDGHDAISCVLQYRPESETDWSEVPMQPLVNDRWQAEFIVTEMGRYRYTVQGWIDRFKSWSRDLAKRVEAGQDVSVELLIGAELIEAASARASGDDAAKLQTYAAALRSGGEEGVYQALSPTLAKLMYRYDDRRFAHTYPTELAVIVDPEYARFSAWYELFPRSFSPEPGEHGTFKDVEAQLPYVASMGFDILYLPPIHPIGRVHRKGKNNSTTAEPDDPGSPWAIGSDEGGHKSIHPQLGTLDDFRHLVQKAGEHGLKIALDIAFQCAPDHPYVKEHPQWFRQRPDGTVQYAENPPKKYQDIYPFDFETDDWPALWEELKSVIQFWIDQGVRVFRVDNPHTKPFRFWEWLISDIKKEYPETIFLSEAFTRPKVMYQLAKLGFTQSYNYFPWRNSAWELTQFMTEVTQTEVREYFRPNLWPNTPDILPQYLQYSGRPGFIVRFTLAATLGASYGIYGPAFELIDSQPLDIGREEYLNSEKYEIKTWNLKDTESLSEFIGVVNRIRRENPALHSNNSLKFHSTSNEQIICYSKMTDDLSNIMVMVVNLDPHYTQSGFIELPLETFGLDQQRAYQVHELITGNRYLWHGAHNYVELNPHVLPVHIFRVRRWVRTEHDFDYFI
ncbi:MAG: alpha-1,4-glucan--maltose-1-phosphate maltosyltransferase [Anaerolineae bacterium]|nr:alpha-1,4-glucan--maltose-1-phosphate maltosyltransferase [Anaerolineae bacterium]